MAERPTLEDLLAVAEAVLDVDIVQLLPAVSIGRAESALGAPFATFGGVDFYPDPIDRAAILASRIIRNHPLPDGNKRVGLLMFLLELDRVGARWDPPSQDELAEVFEQLAASTLPEAEFVRWAHAHAAMTGAR